MAGHRLEVLAPQSQSWIELILSSPIILWAGWPFFVRGIQSVATRNPNMWTLIGSGTAAAYFYSVVATLAPDVFPASFFVHGRVGVYFEAAAVIVSLTLLGQIFELRARSQTSAAIKSLLGLAPKTARRIRADGGEEDIPLSHVQLGDRLRVRPGEKVPVDGAVEEGQRGGRIHAHRWPNPVSAARRQTDRGDDQRQRQPHHAHRESRRGDRAVPDRTDGGPAQRSRAHAAAGGCGGGLVRGGCNDIAL